MGWQERSGGQQGPTLATHCLKVTGGEQSRGRAVAETKGPGNSGQVRRETAHFLWFRAIDSEPAELEMKLHILS